MVDTMLLRQLPFLSDPEQLVQALREAPELALQTREGLIQMAAYATELQFGPGEALFREGEPAATAYFIIEGRVQLNGSGGPVIERGFIGQESGADIRTFLRDATALGPVRTFAIPRALLREVRSHPSETSLYRSLIERLTGKTVAAEMRKESRASAAGSKFSLKVLGWLLTLALPSALLWWGGALGFDWRQTQFLALLSICLVLLSFHLVPQYAAVLVATLGCLVLGVAPPRVVLSGFASSGFFMALSIFGLGDVLVRSGIALRLVLNLLKYSSVSSFWYQFNFLLLGLLMTPCLPSANARVSLMTPLLNRVSPALRYPEGSKEATLLMFSMFIGCTLFAPIFLTSKSLNFVVFDLLPDQVSEEFQWIGWLAAAALPGILMLLLNLLLLAILSRGSGKPILSTRHLKAQLRLLGPMRPEEWVALLGSLGFIVAITTYSIHKISPEWIAFATFCSFLMLGSLREKQIRTGFDWAALLMIGLFIGLESTMDAVGIGDSLTNLLAGMTHFMATDFELFALLLLGLISIIRLFLPITTTGVLVAGVLLPIANLQGVNPWVVGFVIITLCELWWLPDQCSYYLTFAEAAGSRPVHDRRLFLKLNALSMVIRLGALFAALPFFRFLGVL